MDRRRSEKCPRSPKKANDKNAKRRELYANMKTAEKGAVLMQRRLQKTDTTTKKLLQNTNNADPVEPPSHIQDNLAVATCSTISETARADSDTVAASNMIDKGKTAGGLFYTFEKGSTSNSIDEPYAPDKYLQVGSVSATSNEPYTSAFDVVRTRDEIEQQQQEIMAILDRTTDQYGY